MFGRFTAVDGIDFEIPRGRVVGFLGPNGAGKTTTIRMIAGFLPPTAGRVCVNGLEVWENRLKVNRQIGYLPESAPLYPEMTVREYLRYRCRVFGIPRARRKAAIQLSLRRCWLEDVQRRPIHHLSKGYRQRVGLAAALLHNPPVLILDEPTVGLDPSQIREVRNLIRELAGGHTILLSTHILPEVEQTCDRILMIARGKVRLEGTIDELRQSASEAPRYIVETTEAGARERLSRINGVSAVHPRVEVGERWVELTIEADINAGDLREPIASCMREADFPVRELRREVDSLEKLFIRVVSEAEQDAGGVR